MCCSSVCPVTAAPARILPRLFVGRLVHVFKQSEPECKDLHVLQSASCVGPNLQSSEEHLGVCLGARNEEEMNYMAPSHSPADSISAESQPHGRVCVNAQLINIFPPPRPPPPPPYTHHPKGASLIVMAKGCRCLGD